MILACRPRHSPRRVRPVSITPSFLDHGFEDAYRYLYPDRVQYTWWNPFGSARQRNVGWRIDYFLVSETLMPRVKDVIIHDSVHGSDHCPVELIIE